ncbi:MAG: MCE family protein [Bacteroidia bacterium]|nr:MCE family protein [Bacteroidia bacterium]
MKLSNEAKVGILVTVALAALIWGLNYLKGKDVFTSRNRFYAVYPNVDGLVSSNPVFMNGYRIGIVNSIDFMPDKSGNLVVTLLIEKDVFISRNSVARIFSSDLIGTKALRIDLGDDPLPHQDNDTLLAELEFSFAQQVGKQVGPIKDKTERLIVTMDSLASMLYLLFDPSTKNNLREGISHMNHTLASVDQLMSDDRSKLNVMLNNLGSITTNLKNNNEQISHILSNLSEVSDTLAATRFAGTIANADRTLSEMNELFGKINKGQGTLGQLANNDSLYLHLDHTAQSLDELLKDLKNNPKRYVHFSMFGRKSK